MDLKYQMRPSLTHTNARFRGPTELSKYTNMVSEVAHDLKLLGKTLDTDEFVFTQDRGQTDYIRDNFAAYFMGDSNFVTSGIKTSADLYTQREPLVTGIDLTASSWMAYGGCVKGGTSISPTLQAVGTSDPCGVSMVVDVQEGYYVYVRMQAQKTSGTGQWFSLGSDNVNQGVKSLDTYALPTDGSAIYVGHVIECKHKESININIDVARGSAATGTVQLSDISITLLDKSHVVLQPLNTSLKAQANILEEDLLNIINNL